MPWIRLRSTGKKLKTLLSLCTDWRGCPDSKQRYRRDLLPTGAVSCSKCWTQHICTMVCMFVCVCLGASVHMSKCMCVQVCQSMRLVSLCARRWRYGIRWILSCEACVGLSSTRRILAAGSRLTTRLVAALESLDQMLIAAVRSVVYLHINLNLHLVTTSAPWSKSC